VVVDGDRPCRFSAPMSAKPKLLIAPEAIHAFIERH
jgi:hypothetical protein